MSHDDDRRLSGAARRLASVCPECGGTRPHLLGGPSAIPGLRPCSCAAPARPEATEPLADGGASPDEGGDDRPRRVRHDGAPAGAVLIRDA